MPNYDYTCADCGHSLEAHQSMKDAPLIACPVCGRAALKRLPGRGAGLWLRGSGVFQTEPGGAGPVAGGAIPPRPDEPRPQSVG